MISYLNYIIRDPKICGEEPVIRGTRVTLRTILASLAEGASVPELLEDFPSLKEEDVRAVIAFAAASAEEDLPLKSLPQEIRKQFSLLPGTEVDVVAENNKVLIVKSRKRNAFLKWVGRGSSTKGDIDMTVDRLRGRTDE